MAIRRPHFLAIGNVCFDIVDDKKILGGSSAYSAILAHNLGYEAAIVTRVGTDFSPALLPAGIRLYPQFGSTTTTFVNRETPYGRIQFVRSVAEPIKLEVIPDGLLSARIVYLCPILNDFSPELSERINADVIGLAPQGWMRSVGADGKVYKQRFFALERVVPKADVVFVSEEDVENNDLECLTEQANILVLTHGKEGAEIFMDGGREYAYVPAFIRPEVDPTGAGDIFGAAFLLHYHETNNPEEAARFGAWAASFVVQGQGTSAIPGREEMLGFPVASYTETEAAEITTG